MQLVFLPGVQNRYVTIQSTQEIARYDIRVIIFTRKRLKARQIAQSDGFTSFVCALAQAPAGDEYMKNAGGEIGNRRLANPRKRESTPVPHQPQFP